MTRRRSVWRLSKLATHVVGTPSISGVSFQLRHETSCDASEGGNHDRTDAATGSPVRIKTDRSPPGVAANQTRLSGARLAPAELGVAWFRSPPAAVELPNLQLTTG